MKKRLLIAMAASVMTLAVADPAFAGTWKLGAAPNNTKWWYDNGNGSWAANGWHWIDGDNNGVAECYYFDAAGWLLTSMTTPDNYQVDANGAWVVNGVVQTKAETGVQQPSQIQNQNQTQTQQTAGWVQDGSQWRYYTGGEYLSSQWRRIDGKRYYFDEDGLMVTGFWEIEGNVYYFTADGALRTRDFTLDDVRYLVESDGVITDAIDVDEWKEYQGGSSGSGSSPSGNSGSGGSSGSGSTITSGSGTSGSGFSGNTSNQSNTGHLYDYAKEVFEIVNQERVKAGKEELTWSDKISELTDIRAEELVEKYSHTRPDGQDCFSVFDENGVETGYCGENIAMGQTSPSHVMNAWMNSTGHRNNILSENYTTMAVGCYSLNGKLHWVQLFNSK